MYQMRVKLHSKDDIRETKNSRLINFVGSEADVERENLVKFTAWAGMADKVDEQCSGGDDLKVTFMVRGREYNGKYYVDLVVRDLDILEKRNSGKAEDDGSLPF